jgi:hypothetical protein
VFVAWSGKEFGVTTKLVRMVCDGKLSLTPTNRPPSTADAVIKVLRISEASSVVTKSTISRIEACLEEGSPGAEFLNGNVRNLSRDEEFTAPNYVGGRTAEATADNVDDDNDDDDASPTGSLGQFCITVSTDEVGEDHVVSERERVERGGQVDPNFVADLHSAEQHFTTQEELNETATVLRLMHAFLDRWCQKMVALENPVTRAQATAAGFISDEEWTIFKKVIEQLGVWASQDGSPAAQWQRVATTPE